MVKIIGPDGREWVVDPLTDDDYRDDGPDHPARRFTATQGRWFDKEKYRITAEADRQRKAQQEEPPPSADQPQPAEDPTSQGE